MVKIVANYIILVILAISSNIFLTSTLNSQNYIVNDSMKMTFIVLGVLTILLLLILQFIIGLRHLRNLGILFATYLIITLSSIAFIELNILNYIFVLALVLIINRNFLIKKELEKSEDIANFWGYIGFSLLIAFCIININHMVESFIYIIANLAFLLHIDKKITEKSLSFSGANIRSTYFIIVTTLIMMLINI